MNNKVSVIIPTYNRAHCIVNTIKSVLNQTYSNIEVIIVDDNSTDNTKELIENSIEDSRVKYIFNSKGGNPAIPRNIGIKQSTGTYIAFLDSDDIWLPQKIEKQIAFMEEMNITNCSTNAFIKDTPHTKLLKIKKQKYTLKELMIVNPIITSSMVLKKDLIDTIKFFPEDMLFKGYEDYVMWLKLSLFEDIHVIDDALIEYSVNSEDSIRLTSLSDNLQQKKNSFTYIKDFINTSNLQHIKSSEKSLIDKELDIIKRSIDSKFFNLLYRIKNKLNL